MRSIESGVGSPSPRAALRFELSFGTGRNPYEKADTRKTFESIDSTDPKKQNSK